MAKGNPNPSPETRFGAENGNPINTGGKTSQQREDEYKASEIAASLRLAALTVMLEKVNSEKLDPLEAIDANILKLFKDSEDRAHGTPTQYTENKHGATDDMADLLGFIKDRSKRLGQTE